MWLTSSGHTVHVDMSHKFHDGETIGIACKSNKVGNPHKGMAIKADMITSWEDEIGIDENYSRLYAICIHKILEGELTCINKLVICNDYPFEDVRRSLDKLFQGNSHYHDVDVTSIAKFREEFDNKIKSLAHGAANSYRERGLQRHRWDKGRSLNVERISYKHVVEKWKEVSEM